MTEEIKEILDKFSNRKQGTLLQAIRELKEQDVKHACVTTEENINKLLNYITNLQNENQSLKEKLNCKEYFSSTMPENTEFVILTKENYDRQQKDIELENIMLKSRNEKAVENAKEKIKRYESYIHDLENGNYPSPTVRQERQELIFRIREQEDLINTLEGGDE